MSNTMQAWTVAGYGAPEDVLTLGERLIPQAGPGNIRVRVLACAVGLPDVFMCHGTYEFKPPLPFTPGQEVVGIVEDANDMAAVRVGQRVLGVTAFYEGHGGFAEQTILTGSSVMSVPETMPNPEAAAFGIPFRTAWIALDERARLQKNETLLVLGAAGGTGFAAVQLGKAMGARVIAVVGDAAKVASCKAQGADEVIVHSKEDFVARTLELTGNGADVVFDPVGGETFTRSQQCLAYNGRLLAIGFASGAWGEANVRDLVLSNRSVLGVLAVAPDAASETRMAEALATYYAGGHIHTVIDTVYPFAETPLALKKLAERKVQGKLVIHVADT